MSPTVNDDVWKHATTLVSVVSGAASNSLRVHTIAVILAIDMPPGKVGFQVGTQSMGDCALAYADFEQVGIGIEHAINRRDDVIGNLSVTGRFIKRHTPRHGDSQQFLPSYR